jgi:hypothetical protein
VSYESYPPDILHAPDDAVPGAIYNGLWFPTITAQDATNAGRLAALGFTAVPTSAWTTGQSIRIGGRSGFQFNWTGAAWAAGAHA